jgi:hypothetical protein
MAKPAQWQPMQLTKASKPIYDELLTTTMQRMSLSAEDARALLLKEHAESEIWINDLYQVMVRRKPDELVWLCIRRRDGKPIMRDWRHFQKIKNELVGPECEGLELYPAESRLVDTSNKYHLFVCADPTYRFPMGYDARDVSDHHTAGARPGLKQRPLKD